MVVRHRVVLAAIAVVAGAGIAASGSLAGSGGRQTGTTAQLTGDVTGTVQAVESGRGARVHVSLHGLERNARYRVVQTRAACNEQDGDVDGADFLVWRRAIRTGRADDAYARGRVRLRASLDAAKSVAVFDVTDRRRPTRAACVSIDVWEHA